MLCLRPPGGPEILEKKRNEGKHRKTPADFGGDSGTLEGYFWDCFGIGFEDLRKSENR